MDRKSQITIFIILGIVILATFFIFFKMSLLKKSADTQAALMSKTEFESRTTSIQDYINNCADVALAQAVHTKGLDPDEISEYINARIGACAKTSSLEGMNISVGAATSNVVITDDENTVKADVNLPVRVYSGGLSKEFRSFSATYLVKPSDKSI